MTSNVEIQLVSIDCEHAIKGETDVPTMLSKAFSAAKHHFMVLDQDPQLKGALSAVLKTLGEDSPDYKRLETDIRLLGQFNAFLHAAQAGLNPSIPEVPEGHEPYGIMKLWQEAA